MSQHDHEWTPIAPELLPDSDGVSRHALDQEAEVWKWCIRCGWLKLGNELFRPGTHQQEIIVAEPGEKR